LVVLLAACSSEGARGPASVELTLLSFNILHGADDSGELNLEAKGRFISGQGADLVFLQEVDENCERSGHVDQMEILGQLTGMDAEFGSFMSYQGGRYGMGTLSSLPVRATRALELPEGDEPRIALFSEVEVLGRSLLAINVHFNWTQDDSSRYAQASTLLAELGAIDLPIIVAGDFNDVPGSRTMQAFFDAGFETVENPEPTFDARTPSVDIDHVLARSGRGLRLEPLGGEVLDESTLSDHRPVRARVRVVADDASA
jgi:endonuclease/exonuclease/phosphatase family metal-dependent hydrolase